MKRLKNKKIRAFSLAELMVTLLILSIVLSAVMPAVSRRHSSTEAIWKWSASNANAFFGLGADQAVLIGLQTMPQADGVFDANYKFETKDASGTISSYDNISLTTAGDRLVIKKNTLGPQPVSNSHITFFTSQSDGKNPVYAGRLSLSATNIALGRYTLGHLLSNTHLSNSAIETQNNLAIGQSALYGLSTGYENIALGNDTLYSNTTGRRNTALGYQTLRTNDTGVNNNALGYQALFFNEHGYENNAVGFQAGQSLANGYYNTAVGNYTLKYPLQMSGEIATAGLGTGQGNTALGYLSMHYGGKGNWNTSLGTQAGYYTGYATVKSGSNENNVFVGRLAGFRSGYTGTSSKKTNIANTYIGTCAGALAGRKSTNQDFDNSYNVFVGSYSGYNAGSKANKLQSGNTLLGAYSGFNLGYQDPGYATYNTIAGFGAGYSVSGNFNSIYGYQSGYQTTGERNAFFGAKSGFSNSSGYQNVFIGSLSGFANSSGIDNTFIGANSGYNNTTGNLNTFLGTNSGYTNTTGYNNVFIGFQSGNANQEGTNNTFFGVNSGASNLGSYNTYIGNFAGQNNTTGNNNVYIGYNAGSSHDAAASHQLSIASGDSELISGQFGEGSKVELLAQLTKISSGTTEIGPKASDDVPPPLYVSSDSVKISVPTHLGNKLIVGDEMSAPSGQVISIKSGIFMNNENIKGANEIVTKKLNVESGPVNITGNVNINGTLFATTIVGNVASDKRLKNVLGKAEKGLSTIDALDIVRFNYKNDETKSEHVGVIAQDLQKVMPNSVVKDDNGFLNIKINDITFTIVKAVQELHQAVLGLVQDVKTLTLKITTNSQKIEALEKENKELKKQVNDLDARLKKLETAKADK